MNTLSEDHIDQSFCEDIETSWINLLIAERYAKYSEETGKYYIDIPDDLLFERFHHYYNEKDDLGKFFNIKQKEYISLRVLVYKLNELHSKKISGRLASIKQDLFYGVDAIIGYGKKQSVGLDFTFQLVKQDDSIVRCHMPFDTIEKIRRRVKNIIDHEKFETVLTEEMEKLPSDFHLKIVYSGKTYSLYTLIPALKKGEIPGQHN